MEGFRHSEATISETKVADDTHAPIAHNSRGRLRAAALRFYVSLQFVRYVDVFGAIGSTRRRPRDARSGQIRIRERAKVT